MHRCSHHHHPRCGSRCLCCCSYRVRPPNLVPTVVMLLLLLPVPVLVVVVELMANPFLLVLAWRLLLLGLKLFQRSQPWQLTGPGGGSGA